MSDTGDRDIVEGIAIIGISGRFPGARDLGRFWSNLAGAVESITTVPEDELLAAGVDPALLESAAYVRAGGFLDEPEMFDAHFFGFSAREAEITDPQHRVFLEHAWTAMEDAGYDTSRYPGAVGVFAGTSASGYLIHNLLPNREVCAAVGGLQLRIRTDKDFIPSLVAYKLGLTGPSIAVQTACSTSLVAVSMACQSLMSYQCDMAVAGGVSIGSPLRAGYTAHREVFSLDGHCRAFDASASGAVNGNGVGVVILKRLSEALADGDQIRAVIKGFAVNNDGALRLGYTAPSVEGQAEVIAMAQAMAGTEPDSFQYIEAHGSATPLGDAVEIAALRRVFRPTTVRQEFCAVGSVKTNIGHLDAAAGVAGLIKTVLALEHRQIPPSLHFERPNANLELAGSPFYINTRLAEWPRNGTPRRAGVSSFGMGGVNCHVVLEEAPPREPSGSRRPWQLLVLSAKTPSALETAASRLAEHLETHPDVSFPDLAFTLQVGRCAHRYRIALVCRDREDALAALTGRDPKSLLRSEEEVRRRRPVFLLPGLGDQYPGMAAELYQCEPCFREAVDDCCRLLEPHLGLDLRSDLFPEGPAKTPARDADSVPDLRRMLRRGAGVGSSPDVLRDPVLAQPSVFVVDYALARLWSAWGVEPQAFVGYSLGEYVTACLAGVFSLEDALMLVAGRARLIAELPGGAMLAVPLPAAEVLSFSSADLALAAENGPQACVLAGPLDRIEELERRLAGQNVISRRLDTSHAFHSQMMEPVRDRLVSLVRSVERRPPKIPYVSNLTGTWITAEEATDPVYWGEHLVRPVRYCEAVSELWREPRSILLEVGPGRIMSTWALQHPAVAPDGIALTSLPASYETSSAEAHLLRSLARLWLAGVEPAWEKISLHECRRISLPTYPFERRRFWIEPPAAGRAATGEVTEPIAAGPAPGARRAGAAVPALHPRPHLGNPYVAPAPGIETELAALWAGALGVAEIGAHDNFFELGGHSMLVPPLLLRLRESAGLDLPIGVFLEAPTVADLAQRVEIVRREGSAAVLDEERLDLRAEVELDPAIRPEGRAVARLDNPAAVFLTGATGFLGAFLLAELLEQTGAEVYCLVRSADEKTARKKIRDNLKRHGISLEKGEERIRPIPGDLTEPGFGLSSPEFRRLAERIETIYHAGAWVNFTYPYRTLRPVNVGGTRETLRLATAVTTKPLHFISSIAVFAPGSFADGVALEDAPLDTAAGFLTGYGASKWVAEKMIVLARERGLPVTIHRPPAIGGHSTTGMGNARDLVWNLIKGCIQLRAAFNSPVMLDVVPVDFVSRAIVYLSRQSRSPALAFHYSNPRRMRWDDVFAVIRSLDFPLDLLSFEAWRDRLLEAARSASDNALNAFLPLLPALSRGEDFETLMRDHRIDDRNTRRGLAGSPITCPPLDTGLIRTYVTYLAESGFLDMETHAAGGEES